MTSIKKVSYEIKRTLKETAPQLTQYQISRRNKILNSTNPNFKGYGHKVSEIEKIVKEIVKKYQCTFETAIGIFKNFISSDIHEENLIAVFFLNQFKISLKSVLNIIYRLYLI